jgi:hypothetical protein
MVGAEKASVHKVEARQSSVVALSTMVMCFYYMTEGGGTMVVRITTMILRISALLALILGMLFWAGQAESLVEAHMLLGLLVALSLWVLGVALAITQTGNWWLTGGAFVLAGAMLIFGLIQERLLPGTLHWVIQVIHLLLGLSALGLGEIITRRYKQFSMRVTAEAALH